MPTLANVAIASLPSTQSHPIPQNSPEPREHTSQRIQNQIFDEYPQVFVNMNISYEESSGTGRRYALQSRSRVDRISSEQTIQAKLVVNKK